MEAPGECSLGGKTFSSQMELSVAAHGFHLGTQPNPRVGGSIPSRSVRMLLIPYERADEVRVALAEAWLMERDGVASPWWF